MDTQYSALNNAVQDLNAQVANETDQLEKSVDDVETAIGKIDAELSYELLSDGFKYKFVPEKKSFADAEAACVVEGGHLAMSKTLASLASLNDFTAADGVWIGIEKSDSNTIHYVDDAAKSTPVDQSLTNWDTSEPSANASLKCASIATSQKWTLVDCTATKFFLCQRNS